MNLNLAKLKSAVLAALFPSLPKIPRPIWASWIMETSLAPSPIAAVIGFCLLCLISLTILNRSFYKIFWSINLILVRLILLQMLFEQVKVDNIKQHHKLKEHQEIFYQDLFDKFLWDYHHRWRKSIFYKIYFRFLKK